MTMLIERLRHACAASDLHDHDGCACSDDDLYLRHCQQVDALYGKARIAYTNELDKRLAADNRAETADALYKALLWNHQDQVEAALERGIAEGLEQAARIANEWLDPQTLKLATGEMTAQEMRTAQAIIKGIIARIKDQ